MTWIQIQIKLCLLSNLQSNCKFWESIPPTYQLFTLYKRRHLRTTWRFRDLYLKMNTQREVTLNSSNLLSEVGEHLMKPKKNFIDWWQMSKEIRMMPSERKESKLHIKLYLITICKANSGYLFQDTPNQPIKSIVFDENLTWEESKDVELCM